ncbi:hypothetical protein L226DRAFT_144300 [Lentinus tigrinus ALCF2SS1-7]|uniref:uncharacterized protein n=1 Tax=Lentinus tigrinus ALCF2SS1-7 TaxID=1328758 RepID=UPI001165D3BE|nr:hypothetical protein L226DRAFT_144300 [Lentinus tigrinus ALCF2SS1-7]
MAHMRPTGSGKERVYGLVFLVPLTTIHIYLSRWQTGWRRSLILPWDDWGPTGARIVSLMKVNVLSLSLATYGSGCVLTIRTPWITNLVVLDAHPWVQQCGWHGVTRKTLQLHGDAMAVDSSDVQSFVVMGPSRKEKTVVLEGRFPCRMVLYTVLRNAEYRGIHTVLTGEELVVIRTREW